MIVTARLELRPFVRDDLAAFVAYRGDPEVARYQSWSPEFSEADGEAFIAAVSARVLGGTEWVNVGVVLRETGVLIGDVALCVDPDRQCGEIGFTFATKYQGHGYGREAVGTLCGFAFEEAKLPRLRAITDARNAPANRLLEAVGFRRAGFHGRDVPFKGERCDELLFERSA